MTCGASREMAEIHELHVAFLLGRMDAQDPTTISERIGIEPTHAHRKGGAHPTRTNPDLKWRNSIWALDSRLPSNARLDEHLQDILDRLDSRAAEIARIAQMAGALSSAAASSWKRRMRGLLWPPKRSRGWLHSAVNLAWTSTLATRPMIHLRETFMRASLVAAANNAGERIFVTHTHAFATYMHSGLCSSPT